MGANWRYFKYVARHKWFVFQSRKRFGVGLWQAAVHDWHKFLPSEWSPYVDQFYRTPKPADREGYYHNPEDAKVRFNTAWIKHIHRGPHHWQHWLLMYDSGDFVVLPMPEKYVREMLADWSGAGRAQGFSANPLGWYAKNRDRMTLHPRTRERVDGLIGYHVIADSVEQHGLLIESQ